jgi:Alpha/beta hydrolase domain
MSFRSRTVLGSVLAAMFVTAGAANAKTPIPRVTGPLPVSEASYPFGAADHQLVPQDLSRRGYVEEEYLVSGEANVYEWPAPGPAVVRTPDVPYTTRVLVRRPARRTRFSGNVVVEMLNPSNLFDLNIGWALSHEQFMRNGDVWVGITAKPIAVAALKAFDPLRYGSLSFANPLPLDDPRNCTNIQTVVDPPALRSRSTEDGLVWDIYSHVGAWLRSGAGSNPLAYGRRGSRVEHAYGFGYSQTGGYLVNYINAIHPLVGKPIYDGYLVGVAGGAFVGAVPINQCSPAPPVNDPRRQIRDAGVPVIRIMSQSD